MGSICPSGIHRGVWQNGAKEGSRWAAPLLSIVVSTGCGEDRLVLIHRQVLQAVTNQPGSVGVPVRVVDESLHFEKKTKGRVPETSFGSTRSDSPQYLPIDEGRITSVRTPSGEELPYAVSDDWDPERPAGNGKLVPGYPLGILRVVPQSVPLSTLDRTRIIRYSQTHDLLWASGVAKGTDKGTLFGLGLALLVGGGVLFGVGGAYAPDGDARITIVGLGFGAAAVGAGIGLTIAGSVGLTEKKAFASPELLRLDSKTVERTVHRIYRDDTNDK